MSYTGEKDKISDTNLYNMNIVLWVKLNLDGFSSLVFYTYTLFVNIEREFREKKL